MTLQILLRDNMSSVDAAWLKMENPTNLMMITGILVFEERLDLVRVKATLAQRFLRFRRFRQRIVRPGNGLEPPYWQLDPHFDLDYHVRRIALPEPADHAVLEEMVGYFMSTPLDLTKPPWMFHLIENYDGKSVLLVRLHHSIADGIALVRVMLSLADEERDAVWTEPPQPAERPQGFNPLGPFSRPLMRAVKTTGRTGATVVRVGRHAYRNPERVVDIARTASETAFTAGRLFLMQDDPRTVFKGPLGVMKGAAWSRAVPLDEVKAIGRAVGGTINDVLLTAVAGALRRYLMERGSDPADFRAVIPVNMRPLDGPIELGNRFGLVFLALPIAVADPVARLLELKRRMDRLKASPEALVVLGMLTIVGAAPSQVEELVVDILDRKATAVMTNVPGPRQQLYFAGSAIDHMMFWVPQSGRLGLGVSIFSYNGQVRLGVAGDSGLMPDPQRIIAAFHEELEALRITVRELVAQVAAQLDASRPAPEPPDAAETPAFAPDGP